MVGKVVCLIAGCALRVRAARLTRDAVGRKEADSCCFRVLCRCLKVGRRVNCLGNVVNEWE